MKSAYQLELEGKLSSLIEPIVSEAGAELVELQLVQRKSSALLRLLVDKAGGISLDDCAEISHRVSFFLETADPIEGRYTLEVSSPGLDRPLISASDFKRKIGKPVRLSLRNESASLDVSGEIVKVEENVLTLVTAKGEEHFPLEIVIRGKLIY